MTGTERLRGLVFAKQYPNSAEPSRGVFNAVQVAATSPWVDWRVIAPVPGRLFGIPTVGRPSVEREETRDGVSVTHPSFLLPPRHLAYMRVAGWMARGAKDAFEAAVRDHRPQFVHAHALYPSGAAAALLARRAGVPLVVSVHGSDLYTLAGRPAWRERIAAVVAQADAVVCVSTSLARDVSSLLGLPLERIDVVPDAYDDSRFQLVERDRASADRVRLVCVARLVDVKGPDVLVEALGALVSGGADVELTLVGEGPMRTALIDRAKALGVANRLLLAGSVPSRRLPEILADADVYVQPSRREGFGVALVEALATGLPAVATRSGGPEDIMSDDEGVLVTPGDAAALADGVRAVVARLDSFDAVAIAGRARDRFSRAVVGARLAAVYERVARFGSR